MSKKEREAASEPMATMWSTKVLSQDVFRVCLCLGPVIKKKKNHSHSGHPGTWYFPYHPSLASWL